MSDLFVLIAALVILVMIAFFAFRRRPRKRWIVIDGSNVLYWDGEKPRLDPVRGVARLITEAGFTPVVWFDANVGYLIGDRYMGPPALARALNLPARQVLVAPKGTPADPLLLEGAAMLKARVITNDRFRDWEEAHPEVREAGFLVRGRIDGKVIRLEL